MYKKVERDSALNVRVFALWTGGRSVDAAKRVIAERAAMTRPYENTGDDRVIAGGVKLYIDGSGGARTAWLYDDWNKDYRGTDPGNRGYPTSNADTIRMLIRMYHDAGMHVAVHSIGDRAIDWVVDTYDQAMRENPKKGLRHGDHPRKHSNGSRHRCDGEAPARLRRRISRAVGDVRLVARRHIRGQLRRRAVAAPESVQDVSLEGDDLGERIGLQRDALPCPLRGSGPQSRASHCSASTAEIRSAAPSRSDVHDALRAVTIWAARQMFLEKKIGSIEVGKYADLAVWDRDFYSVPTEQIKDAKCLMTIFNGKVVFEIP